MGSFSGVSPAVRDARASDQPGYPLINLLDIAPAWNVLQRLIGARCLLDGVRQQCRK
jgi:hypothetical protein